MLDILGFVSLFWQAATCKAIEIITVFTRLKLVWKCCRLPWWGNVPPQFVHEDFVCCVCFVCKRLCVQFLFLKFGIATYYISCLFKMPDACTCISRLQPVSRRSLRAKPETLSAFPPKCWCAVFIYFSTANSQFWACLLSLVWYSSTVSPGFCFACGTWGCLTLYLSGVKIVCEQFYCWIVVI